MPQDRIVCQRCRHSNLAGAVFCGDCGGKLDVLECRVCQAANPPGNKFCRECGAALSLADAPAFGRSQSYTPRHLAEKILISPSALEGERKQVTVLFVDVAGFTHLGELLDPEDLHQLMKRAFELMLAEVHRYEGTVNQFLGDGIMALFGAPIAHEDHAQRAVNAALGLRRALERYRDDVWQHRQISFEVRQGLNSGLVVVGSIGSDLRMDYTAVGDTTNTAFRLQEAAGPGRVLISDATHRLVEGHFEARLVEDLHVKGKEAPLRAWEVVSARQVRTDLATADALTPFIGRVRELQLLGECFEKAKAGRGQAVFVVGEPGIGKSRLLREFRARLGREATWVEGHCVSFGRSIAFHPLIDLLKHTFRVEDGDTEATIIDKIERAVTSLGADLRDISPYLRYLLSVNPGDPSVATLKSRARRAGIFDGLRRLALRAAEVRPQVLILEDLQWIDKASEELLISFIDRIPAGRIVLIATYRTDYEHPFGERTYYTRIAVDVMSSADSLRMAQARFGAANVPKDLERQILRRAEGNPFFIEELLKSLAEVGAVSSAGGRMVLTQPLDTILIPDTVQGVIMSRVDRLPDAAKTTLQLASVIGRNFSRRLLDRIAEDRTAIDHSLDRLTATELIREKAGASEPSYTFKHALTQEVAYNSLLLQRRRELHHRIGLAIEELYGERLLEHYEVLAHHFARAEEWSRDLGYLLKSAEKARKGSAMPEALALYDHALEAVSHLPQTPPATLMSIHEARAEICSILSDFEGSRAAAEQFLTVARSVGDRAKEAAALGSMGFASMYAHDFDAALAHSRMAIEIAREAGERTIVSHGHYVVAFVHAVIGQQIQAREAIDHTIAISRSAGDVVHQSLGAYTAGLLKNWEGQYGQARLLMAEGLATARQYDLLMPLIRNLFGSAIVLTAEGAYDDALATLDEGLAVCEKVSDELYHHRFVNTLGWLYFELGDLERALELNRTGAAAARKRREPETIAYAELNAGDIFLAQGDLVLARELLEGVHRLANDPTTTEWMRWRYSMRAFASLSELHLTRGDFDAARGFADQCLEISARTSSRKYLARGWRLRGQISAATRQWDGATAALAEALNIAEAVGNPTELWKAHAAIGSLRRRRNDEGGKRAAHAAARSVIEAARSRIKHPTLQTALVQSTLVGQLDELVNRE